MYKSFNAKNLNLPGVDSVLKEVLIPLLVSEDCFGAYALVGESGTGKTTIISRIASVMQKLDGTRFGIYSADKVNYQDLVGLPWIDTETDPNAPRLKMAYNDYAMSNKEMVLIDETNRATPDNQEKFLQLISTRTIDGYPTKNKYLYFAMNPILQESEDDSVYDGTIPLDKAFGERIIGLSRMKSLKRLSNQEKKEVIFAAMNQVRWEPSDEVVQDFQEFLIRAKELYNSLKHTVLNLVVDFVTEFTEEYIRSKGPLKLEARRLQFIALNTLALASLNKTAGITNRLTVAGQQAINISFPNTLWQEEVPYEGLNEVFENVKHILENGIVGEEGAVVSSPENSGGILSRLNFLEKEVTKDKNLETLSNGLINILDNIEDKVQHTALLVALYSSIEDNIITLKENDKATVENLVNEITSSKEFSAAKSEIEKYKNSENSEDKSENLNNLTKTKVYDYEVPENQTVEDCEKEFSTWENKTSSLAQSYFLLQRLVVHTLVAQEVIDPYSIDFLTPRVMAGLIKNIVEKFDELNKLVK